MNASTDQSSEKNFESISAEDIVEQNKPRINVPLVVVSILLLVVASAMIFTSLSTYIKGETALQYKTIDGTVVKIDEHFDAFGVRKQAEMRFVIKGKEERALADLPADRIMKPGELTVVFYDQNNPQNAVLSQEIDYDTVEVQGAFGFFFFCFGALAAVKARRRPESGV